MARLPVVVRHDVFFAIAHAIDGVFIWALPAMVLAFVVARDSATAPDKAAAAVPELVR